jgi:hypothetical protein
MSRKKEISSDGMIFHINQVLENSPKPDFSVKLVFEKISSWIEGSFENFFNCSKRFYVFGSKKG